MLRGQASLQELIGRSFMTRKRSGSKGKKPQAPPNTGSEPANTRPAQTSSKAVEQKQQVLQAGHVSCPVCGGAILQEILNTHLDACLARETLQRSKGDAKQSTLAFQNSSRPNSATSKKPATGRRLQRSATAAGADTITHATGSKANARRTSSDSALLVSQQQHAQQQTAAEGTPGSLQQSLPIKPWQPNIRPKANADSSITDDPKCNHGKLLTDRSPISEQPVVIAQDKQAGSHLSNELSSEFAQQLSPRSAARQPDGTVIVQTNIVGRRFRTGVTCSKLTPVCVSRQPDNVRDPNAIQVIDATSRQVLGYLPRDIAQHLAGLLDAASVTVTATVDEPKSVAAVVPIMLQIAPDRSADIDQTRLDAVLDVLVKTAAEWQANGLKRQGSGTGACLRTNFLLMADTVLQQDSHLLIEDEKQLLSAFKDLFDEAQCLFLRLFLRKGPWFRINTLSYSELSEPLVAAQELSDTAMAHCTSTDAEHCWQPLVMGLAEALSVAELQQLIASLELLPQGKASGGSKGQMLQRLQAGLDQAQEPSQEIKMRQQMLDLIGPCIKLSQPPCDVVRRVQRLFFLNEAQNLSSFLVADLGVAKYPSYRVSRSRSVFTTRQDLLDYEQALLHAAELDNALEDFDTEAAEQALRPAFAAINADLHKQQPAACHGNCSATQLPFFLRYSSAWVYAAMATTGVSLLEKRKQWQEAVELLQQLLGGVCCLRRRGEWWTRLSLDLEHLGRPDESLEMAEAALADEWVINGDRIALQRRVLRLGKPPRRWKRPYWAAVALREPLEVRIEGQPLASVLGIKSRFIGNGGEECSVEELALQYYAAEDKGAWTGKIAPTIILQLAGKIAPTMFPDLAGTHAEGGIWATFFGLLMWDILFMAVPDVFQTAFQTAPLDLGTVVFYPTRQEAIEKRLAQIRGGKATALLRHCWQQHFGQWCRGVNWERHSLDELVSIGECVGGRGLAAICALLAQDFSGWAGGMPDLLLWNVHTCRAKLSEVKGPRDRLSDQQRAWINALIDAEVDVEVLKVVEPRQGNVPKRRKKW